MKQEVRRRPLLWAAVVLGFLMCMAIGSTSTAYADSEPLMLNDTDFDLQEYDVDSRAIYPVNLSEIDPGHMDIDDPTMLALEWHYDGSVSIIPLAAGLTNVTLYNSYDENDSVKVKIHISQNYVDGYVAKYEMLLQDYYEYEWDQMSDGTWWLELSLLGVEDADDYNRDILSGTVEVSGTPFTGETGYADTGNYPYLWFEGIPSLSYNTTVAYDLRCGPAHVTGSFTIPKVSIKKRIAEKRIIVKGPAASVTYTGKALKPSVKLREDWGDRAMKLNTEYKLAYSSNKNVGKAKVVITGLGNYNGTVTKYFKIIPKGTTISKLTPGKKKMTVKWKKQATQTQGYQIRYSLKSSMKNAKTVKVTSNKTTKKTIKKLKSKKKYYVQIRTYKTVKGTTYWSKWSAKKSVKVK